jgi:hypothetical protein
LNYWFVSVWGERVKAHFRQRHLQLREQTQQAALAPHVPQTLPAQTR